MRGRKLEGGEVTPGRRHVAHVAAVAGATLGALALALARGAARPGERELWAERFRACALALETGAEPELSEAAIALCARPPQADDDSNGEAYPEGDDLIAASIGKQPE